MINIIKNEQLLQYTLAFDPHNIMLPENHNGKPLKMYEFVEESAAY